MQCCQMVELKNHKNWCILYVKIAKKGLDYVWLHAKYCKEMIQNRSDIFWLLCKNACEIANRKSKMLPSNANQLWPYRNISGNTEFPCIKRIIHILQTLKLSFPAV